MPDYAAANDDIWPSQNDVAQTAGNGKKLLENQWQEVMAALTAANFVYTGGVLPASSANLNIDVPACQAMISGRFVDIPGSTTITAAASATSHVYLKLLRDGANLVTGAAFEVNTAGTPPADSVKIGTLVASGSAITSTTDARSFAVINQARIMKPSVGTPELKTATGSATVTDSANVIYGIVLNDYSFAPTLYSSDGSSTWGMWVPQTTDPANTVARIAISGAANGVTFGARWRYVTASDDPTVWIAVNPASGDVVAVWVSDDPPSVTEDVFLDDPMEGLVLRRQQRILPVQPISVPNSEPKLIPLEMLSQFAIPQAALDAADRHIEAKKLNPSRRLYRALQFHTRDIAPSGWLHQNGIYKAGEFRALTPQERRQRMRT